jgi:hypothetical protein
MGLPLRAAELVRSLKRDDGFGQISDINIAICDLKNNSPARSLFAVAPTNHP